MNVLSNLLWGSLYALVGGLWIGWGIEHFKEGRYFKFGFCVSLAVFEMFCLLNLILTGA